MKRIFFLSVALSTFLFGSVLVWLYSSYTKTIDVKTIPLPHKVEMRSEKVGLLDGIKPTARGCGNGYFQAYELPDGTKMGEANACYRSFKKANYEMRMWLRKAGHIIERVAPSERRGEPKSERVVASFPEDEFGHRWVVIMWVHSRCIHSINAPNLESALEFEKSKFNPYKFED